VREHSFNKSHSYIESNCLNRFRWVFCQLDALKKCIKPGSIRKALQTLPKTLDDTYARILMNINEECRQEARRALLWLAFSERPLLLEEVAEAAVVDPDAAFDPDERLPDPNYVLEILGSLVTVSSKGVSSDASREIRLAHFSVKEYLISERIRRGEASEFGATSIDANHFIAESCLLYTLHYDESDSKTMSPEDLKSFPLLQYACRFWYTHAKSIPVESQKSINPIIFKLFLSDTTLVTWLRVHRPDDSTYKSFGISKDIGSPLYYASDIGLEAVVQMLLEHKAGVNVQDRYGRTALYRAAVNGHDAVVKLLLEAKADVNVQDGDGGTALHWAAEKGHEAVVKLLLETKADVNVKVGDGGTALHWAAGNGQEAVVKLLLEAKADVNVQDGDGGTALHWAAENGHEAVVKLLQVGSILPATHPPA
jgi:ankyrin repeat domain-containing protein 50